MKRPHEYIPVDGGYSEGAADIRTRIGIPEYAGEVVADATRLQRLCRIMGYETLTLAGYDGERDSYNVTASGLNADGSATGAAVRKKTAEDYKLEQSRQDNFMHSRRDGVLRLSVNMRGVSDDVTDQRQLRNTKAWAKAVDGSLREGLRAAASGRLIGEQLYQWPPLAIVWAVNSGLYYLFPGGRYVENYTIDVALSSLFSLTFIRCMDMLSGGHSFKDERLSALLPVGPQLDRWAAAQVLLRTQKLVVPGAA